MTLVSRADLLRLWLNQDAADTAALEFFGYEQAVPLAKEVRIDLRPFLDGSQIFPATVEVGEYHTAFPYFALSKIEQLAEDEQPQPATFWLEKSQEPVNLPTVALPQTRALYDWLALKTVLNQLIYTPVTSSQFDLKKLVADMAKLKPLNVIPKMRVKRRVKAVSVFVDFAAERLRPLFDDFIDLREELRAFIGLHFERVHSLKEEGIAKVLHEHAASNSLAYLQGIAAVVVISDCGLYREDDQVLEQWLEFAAILRSFSCQAIALLPVPARLVDARLAAAFTCVCLEGAHIPQTSVQSLEARQQVLAGEAEKADKVLTALQTSPYVQPPLLRAARDLLTAYFPDEGFDVASEVLVWNHPQVYQCASFCTLRFEHQLAYQKKLDSLPRDLKRAVRKLFIKYHAIPHFQEELMVELASFDALCGFYDEHTETVIRLNRNLARRLKSDPNPTRSRFVQVVLERYPLALKESPDHEYVSVMKALLIKAGETTELDGWEDQSIVRRIVDSPKNAQGDFYMQVFQNPTNILLTLRPGKKWEVGSVEANGHSVSPAEALMKLAEDEDEYVRWSVSENANTPAEALMKLAEDEDYDVRGSVAEDSVYVTATPLSNAQLSQKAQLILDSSSQGESLFIELTFLEGRKHKEWLGFSEGFQRQIDIAGLESLTIQTKRENFIISNFNKPPWAQGIAKTQKGLEVYTENQTLYWVHEETTTLDKQKRRGFWSALRYNDGQKPPWAESIGEDAYGLYADLVVGDASQRMRWIEPGDFMMGSPETEEDHHDDEVLHKVRLTEGYWLAETACSQAFYQAVMGENPSYYKGEDLPVENVSWEDAQEFTQKLNELTGSSLFRLPTEAEWEYACRAGTSTAFAYGETIDGELTNYGGNNGESVPVDSFYRNVWGLVQMHGNIWEWCSDWYATYDTTESIVLNPQGPLEGVVRVLRGGSWLVLAWYCRSAVRIHSPPGRRFNYSVGFRLASGHQLAGSGTPLGMEAEAEPAGKPKGESKRRK